MMKRIMTPRAAAVAFAASALIAAPAVADPGHGKKHDPTARHINGALQLDVGNGLSVTLANNGWSHAYNGYRGGGYYGYRGDRHYGYQDHRRIRELRRDAIRACKRAVRHEARDRGYRRARLDEVERVRQIGPRGFKIRAEFEFEGRGRDFERDVTCTVRRGRVVNIDNLPRARRGYRNSDHRYRDDRYYGNDHLKRGNRRNN